MWCSVVGLNHRPFDYQSNALPTELTERVWKPRYFRIGSLCSCCVLGPSFAVSHGASGEARTPDLSLTRRLLFQLSYKSIWKRVERTGKRLLPPCAREFCLVRRISTVYFVGSLFGTRKGTRTPDPLLRRQLLYPAELQAHITSCPRKSLTALPSTVPVSFHLQSRHPIAVSFADGAGDGNRTHATSLEGWDSTIELHPHKYVFRNR